VLASLHRLVQPLHEVLTATLPPHAKHSALISILLREMAQRGSPYWAWSADQWAETIAPSSAAFARRHRVRLGDHRYTIIVLAVRLGGFTAFHLLPAEGLKAARLVRRLFGGPALDTAVAPVLTVVRGWGYSAGCRDDLEAVIARTLLATGSPHLEAVRLEVLAALRATTQPGTRFSAYGLLSRALVELHILEAPLPIGKQAVPPTQRYHTDGVAADWLAWCYAWFERSHLVPDVRDSYLGHLICVGRWLARTHPTVTSPAQWDHDLVLEYVTAVTRMTGGEWGAPARVNGRHVCARGQPLKPRTQNHYLGVLRRFFADLQDLPHRVGTDPRGQTIPRRFNPVLAFRTPRAIKNLIGPDPRVIDDAWWWKLLAAAESLSDTDLPQGYGGVIQYPLALVRAVAATWCYSGRRSDEIKRLRVGCIRWQWEDGMRTAADEHLPADALCFLAVPVNKTSGAFTVPVYALVGRAIEAWEAVRPPQPNARDPKTNERVDFLFSYRGHRLSGTYINTALIPLLCARAGVPLADRRGTITSHRARATIATALYNAPEGLTLAEVQQFLGHRNIKDTQAYVKLSPTKLAASVARANRTSRLVPVLLDPQAAAHGEPALFYYLGEGSYCANPAWATCAYRMACLRCPMHVPADVARHIEARDGIQHLLQEVQLTDEERAVAEGDVAALTTFIARHQGAEPPPVPDTRYVFNPSALAATRGRPLPLLKNAGRRPASP
jgi:integrase